MIGLISSCIIYRIIYQKYHDKFNYAEAIQPGFKRSPLFLATMLILILPSAIFGCIYYFISTIDSLSGFYFPFLLLGVVVIFIPNIIAFLYCSLSSMLVINKNMNPLQSLAYSYQLTKGYFFKTLLLIVIYSVLSNILAASISFDWANIALKFITTAFLISLLISHGEQLELTKKEPSLIGA